LGYCLSQHSAQPASRRMKPAVLERVDSLLHAALVNSEGHRPHKRRRCKPAGPAKRGGCWTRGRCGRGKGIAAARARGAALDGKLGPAHIANWHRGEPRQRGAAESAESRQEGTTQGVHGTSEHTGHCAPAGSLRWWNVERQRTGVPAEDAPHLGPARLIARRLADSIPGPGGRCHGISKRRDAASELAVIRPRRPMISA
jgi:hypothetical protein